MRRHCLSLIVLLAASGLAACSSSSPSAPSALSGVTINGSLVAPGGGSGSTHRAGLSSPGPAVVVPPGLTVTVTGANVTAPVNATGQFVLLNVPPGNADLRFSAPGVSAAVTVHGLQAGQAVALAVSLTNSGATIESDRRSLGSEEQLEGRVESLPPTTAALAFVVAGRTVATDANTRFFLQGASSSFDALELGQRVHVRGQTGGASLLATTVDIQNTHTDTGLNINGIIAEFSGTASAFQFTVGGRLVKGDALTAFFGNSQFGELANGQTVEVKGSQRDGYVYATRIHVSVEEAEFTGVIAAPITGTTPDLTFVVSATVSKTVTTTALTEVRRKGDTQTPAALQAGMTVTVSGSLLPDGTVIARRINIESDAVGGAFEMTGHIGGLSGACPTIAFSVSGYQITTTGTTVYTPTCASFTNGTLVQVNGTVQSDGTVKAGTVVRK